MKLETFGAALRVERVKIGESVAKFAKETAGISKDDIRDFESGKRAPDKITLKKIVHCFPILMQFEQDIRHGNFEAPSEIRNIKPRRNAPPKAEPTRLPPPPRSLVPPKRLEIVRQHELPPEPLAAPLAPVLIQALKKTRTEMLTELAGMVKKRAQVADDHELRLRNDGKALIVKLYVSEGKLDEDGELELVDSGCYLTVGARGPTGLAVLCKTMTNGNFSDMLPRVQGVAELLQLAKMLHDAVKDRRFE